MALPRPVKIKSVINLLSTNRRQYATKVGFNEIIPNWRTDLKPFRKIALPFDHWLQAF